MRTVEINFTVENEPMDLEVCYKVRASVLPGERATRDCPASGPELDVLDVEVLEAYDEDGTLTEYELNRLKSALLSEFFLTHDGSDRLIEDICRQAGEDELDEQAAQADTKYERQWD